jgi:hypothetical protein
MPNTFTLISSKTVASGGAAIIDFTSIPQTYTDLILFHSTRGVGSANTDSIYARFNSSSTGYTGRVAYGDNGYGTFSPGISYLHLGYGADNLSTTNTNNTYGNTVVYIPSYTSSNNKSVLVETAKESMFTGYQTGINALITNLWSNSAAVSNITLYCASGGNIAEGSTAYLYGIIRS